MKESDPSRWTMAQREAVRWADASADGVDETLDRAIRDDVIALAAFLPDDDFYAAEKLSKLYVEPLRIEASSLRRHPRQGVTPAAHLEARRHRQLRFWLQILTATAMKASIGAVRDRP